MLQHFFAMYHNGLATMPTGQAISFKATEKLSGTGRSLSGGQWPLSVRQKTGPLNCHEEKIKHETHNNKEKALCQFCGRLIKWGNMCVPCMWKRYS